MLLNPQKNKLESFESLAAEILEQIHTEASTHSLLMMRQPLRKNIERALELYHKKEKQPDFESTLRALLRFTEIAMWSDGDVFGNKHNEVMDSILEARLLLADKKANE